MRTLRRRARRKKQPRPSKVQRRVRQLPDGPLLQWASRCTYDVGQALLEFQRESSERPLIFAERAADALALISHELRERWRSQGLTEGPTGLAELDEVEIDPSTLPRFNGGSEIPEQVRPHLPDPSAVPRPYR